MLWTEKYKPKKFNEISNQQTAIKKLLNWFDNFKPGKACILVGPSGCGKSLIAEVLAKEKNLELHRLSVSEKLNKEKIEKFAGSFKSAALFKRGKLALIEDVDGIPATDRGAVNALVKFIQSSNFPIIITAIDVYKSKLRPILAVSDMIKLTKVPTPSILSKLKEICKKENIEASDDVLKALARWSQGDLRSAINDLQMVCIGKKRLTMKDLEVLGYRERTSSVFEILPTVFRSGSISAGEKAISDADKDPDELFLWIEENLQYEFSKELLPKAYEVIAEADYFRSLVRRQQNWRFKRYMIDLLAALSLLNKNASHKFVSYKPPSRIKMLGGSKHYRAIESSVLQKIASLTHCSKKVAKRDYLPFLKIIARKYEIANLDLEKEEIKIFKKINKYGIS